MIYTPNNFMTFLWIFVVLMTTITMIICKKLKCVKTKLLLETLNAEKMKQLRCGFRKNNLSKKLLVPMDFIGAEQIMYFILQTKSVSTSV